MTEVGGWDWMQGGGRAGGSWMEGKRERGGPGVEAFLAVLCPAEPCYGLLSHAMSS